MGWQAVANVGGIVSVCLDVLKKALELFMKLSTRILIIPSDLTLIREQILWIAYVSSFTD